MAPRYSSPLHRFIEEWIIDQGTTWSWLLKNAGVSLPVGSDVRRGSTPRPETLRCIAGVMGVPQGRLFALAGYIRDEDLTGGPVPPLTAEEVGFLAGYRTLSSEGRRLIRGALRGVLRQQDR